MYKILHIPTARYYRFQYSLSITVKSHGKDIVKILKELTNHDPSYVPFKDIYLDDAGGTFTFCYGRYLTYKFHEFELVEVDGDV